MKRFVFSLEAVRQLRDSRRDEAERQLARAAAEVERASEQVENVLRSRDAAFGAYRDALDSGDANPHDMAMRAAYFSHLNAREAQARAQLAETESARDRQRQSTLAAAREAEAVTKLRERHRERHEQEAARAEQNNLDEMATLAAARRSANL